MIFTQRKNSIISFVLIVSTLLMPLSFIPKKADAQSVTGHTTGLNISSLPQCSSVSLTTKLLFAGAVGSLSAAVSGNNAAFSVGAGIGSAAGAYIADSLTETLTDTLKNAVSSSDSINVNIDGTQAADNIKDAKKAAEAAQKDVSALKDNSTCTAAIGRIITKMLLQKITVSTVNWINSGFNGSPAFVQDPGKFFGDIAKNEVLQFGLEINNPELFPFGKAWMQNTAAAFNNKFQDNARYSLNKLIQDTNPESSDLIFGQDFSQGGWNAWTAMTQSPANNPLGFKLMADNELQSRLEGTTQSTAQAVHEALSQANGFLGDQRCVDPEGVTQQEDAAAKLERQTHPQVVNKTNDPTSKDYKVPYVYVHSLCKQWQYVTPGSLIASAATDTIGLTKDSLLSVNDLNDAIEAVTNALLSQFSSTMMEKGFSNIGDNISGSSSFSGSDYQTRTQQDFRPDQLSSSWLSENPDFNIRTDLTQALIDEQRTYSDKLALQNKELMSTTDGQKYSLAADGKSSNAYGLMPAIYQLDYCIPGPHPGYEQDSYETLSKILDLVPAETEASLESREEETLGSVIGSVIGGIVSSIPVVGAIFDALSGGDDQAKVRGYYAAQINALTGIIPNSALKSDSLAGMLTSKQTMTQIMNEILNRYTVIMNKTYFSSPDILPTVSGEAAENFNQIKGYKKIMADNENKIISLKTTISLLGEIKDKVNELNAIYPNGGTDYENQLSAQINKFGRLSADMVNGSDIAKADNLYKQIVDKKNYIYKNLLKGPYGCEADLMKDQIKFPSVRPGSVDDWANFDANSVRRMTYPEPILYNYNQLVKNTDLPDPWGSGYKNKMTKNDKDSDLGPGFLSFVYFGGHPRFPDSNTNLLNGPERLSIADLFPVGTEVPQFNFLGLGLRKFIPRPGLFMNGNAKNISDILPGRFESTIKVY